MYVRAEKRKRPKGDHLKWRRNWPGGYGKKISGIRQMIQERKQ